MDNDKKESPVKLIGSKTFRDFNEQAKEARFIKLQALEKLAKERLEAKNYIKRSQQLANKAYIENWHKVNPDRVKEIKLKSYHKNKKLKFCPIELAVRKPLDIDEAVDLHLKGWGYTRLARRYSIARMTLYRLLRDIIAVKRAILDEQ